MWLQFISANFSVDRGEEWGKGRAFHQLYYANELLHVFARPFQEHISQYTELIGVEFPGKIYERD